MNTWRVPVAIYDFGQWHNHINRIQRLISGPELAGIFVYAGNAAGLLVEQKMKPYPPEPAGRPLPYFYTRTRANGSTYKSKFKSAKQQAYVIKLYKDGRAPYKRTGFYGRSWTTVTEFRGVSIVIKVGNNANRYNIYVGGPPGTQNYYHRQTGWLRLDEESLKLERDVYTVFNNVVNIEIRRRIQP